MLLNRIKYSLLKDDHFQFKQSIRTFTSIPSYSSTFIQSRNFSSPFPLINYPSFSSSFLHDYPSFPRASFPLWRPASVYLDLNEDDFRIDKKPVEEPSFVSEETYWYIQQQMMKPASITRHEKKRPSIFKLLFVWFLLIYDNSLETFIWK